MRRRALLVLPITLASACSLFVDTDDLANGKAAIDAAPDALMSDAGVGDVSSSSDASDASDGRPPLVYPPAAKLWPVNGHAYLVVLERNVTFLSAKLKAEQAGGHLATATSEDENDFIWTQVLKAGPDAITQDALGPFIGGLQDEVSANASSDWHWITGETWSFTAWADGEPNDAEDERALIYYTGPRWADIDHVDAVGAPGYVVEFE